MINALLALIGLPSKTVWLGKEETAIWVLIILAVWQFGSSMLIFLSGLKQVPVSLYEAATVDGASGITKFFKITLPMLTPTIFFNLIYGIYPELYHHRRKTEKFDPFLCGLYVSECIYQ